MKNLKRMIKEENPKLEKKVLKFIRKICMYIFIAVIFGGGLNLILNEDHDKEVDFLNYKVATAEDSKNKIINEVANEVDIITSHKSNQIKVKTINKYFNLNNSGVLKGKGNIFVQTATLYGLDPYRLVSIAAHESNGNSYAAKNQNNICGINWSNEEVKQLKKRGYNPSIYNIKIYGSIDENILSLGFKLKYLYKDVWGLTTLSEIQTRYAPTSDPRQGLDGMDNTIWTQNTIKIYYKLQEIEEGLK